jgi:hypothetical protein
VIAANAYLNLFDASGEWFFIFFSFVKFASIRCEGRKIAPPAKNFRTSGTGSGKKKIACKPAMAVLKCTNISGLGLMLGIKHLLRSLRFPIRDEYTVEAPECR